MATNSSVTCSYLLCREQFLWGAIEVVQLLQHAVNIISTYHHDVIYLFCEMHRANHRTKHVTRCSCGCLTSVHVGSMLCEHTMPSLKNVTQGTPCDLPAMHGECANTCKMCHTARRHVVFKTLGAKPHHGDVNSTYRKATRRPDPVGVHTACTSSLAIQRPAATAVEQHSRANTCLDAESCLAS